MLHLDVFTAPARPRRLIAAALAFVLVWMLVLAAPIGEAAKGASITITADHQTVKAGDQVTLKIKLQNVDSATLNGEALPAGKDSVQKKVLVCTTTTYTVAAMPKDGGPKISQALTIAASGTTTKAACASPAPAAAPTAVPAAATNPLPDLVVVSLTVSQSYNPQIPNSESVNVAYTVANWGQAPAENFVIALYRNGQRQPGLNDPVLVSLKVGEKASSTISSALLDNGGSYTYSVVVDPDNKIVESDKTNNSKTASILVMQGTNSMGGIYGDTIDKVGKLNHTPDVLKLKP